MIKETKVALGGKERTLWFGAGGFYDHIHLHQKAKKANEKDEEVKKAIVTDPLEWIASLGKRDGKTVIDDLDTVAVIAYAGINSYEDGNDQDNTPYEKVRKWVNGIDEATQIAICTDAFAAFIASMPEPGETQAQAQNGTALVGES